MGYSGDDNLSGYSGSSTAARINSKLAATVPQEINGGNTEIVILFHDIRGSTANNLSGFLQTIEIAVESAGNYVVQFTGL